MSASIHPAGLTRRGAPEEAGGMPRRRRGSAVMQTALALPVLIYFSFGMVEFGQYLYAKHIVQSASRDGCRQAVLGSATQTSATAAVASTMAAAGLGNCGYTVTFTNPSGGATISDISAVVPGNSISTTVTVNYGSVGVRPLGVIPASKQLTGTTTLVKE